MYANDETVRREGVADQDLRMRKVRTTGQDQRAQNDRIVSQDRLTRNDRIVSQDQRTQNDHLADQDLRMRKDRTTDQDQHMYQTYNDHAVTREKTSRQELTIIHEQTEHQDSPGRGNSVLRSIIMVVVVFAAIIFTVVALSFNGTEIPFFSTAFDNLADRNSNGGETSSRIGRKPSELMGSSDAWDGSEIRSPILSLTYDVSEETEYLLFGKYLAECSRENFFLLDKEGTEVFHKYIDFTTPMLYKHGEYMLVSDLGGRSAFLLKGMKLVWEKNFSDGIVNASVNKNGHIAFVLEAVGYRNCVKVLTPIGNTIFDWVVADDYVISSEVAPSGAGLFINRLKTSGVSLCSGLELLDMNPEPLLAIESGEDEVFLSARYLDNNMLAVVTESVLRLYSETGELLMREEFESIMAMCEFPQKKVAVAVKQNNRSLVMEYEAGAPKGRVLYIARRPVVNLTSDNGYLFVNLGHEVAAINENGEVAAHLTLDSETLYGDVSEKFGILAVTRKSADIYLLQ